MIQPESFDYEARQERRQREREAERRAEAARIVAMTPDEHIRKSAEILATPAGRDEWANRFLHAMVHAQLATAKGGVHP